MEEEKYTNTTEETVVDEVLEQYRLSKRLTDPIHQRMNQQEELYRSYIDPAKNPTKAMVFDPRVFRVIETVTPRIVSSEPVGSFYPTESGNMETAEIFNTMLKYDWRKANMFVKQVTFVKSALIFGTAFGRKYWDYKEKKQRRMIPVDIDGKMMWKPDNTQTISVTEFDGPNWEPLNIYDCFPDPNATCKENMRWFIYRRFRTLKELKKENETRSVDGKPFFKNLDQLENLYNAKRASKVSSSDLTYREHRRLMLGTQELIGQDETNQDIVILTRWTKDGWCDICPEYNLCIREVENPYFNNEIPITYYVDYPYPNELFGMGEVEPIERLQRAMNAVLNQRLDNVQLTLNTMWKMRKGAGVDKHTVHSAPGNVITLEDMNGLEPISIPDVTSNTFVATMNYFQSAIQNGSGVTDYTVGVGDNNTVANTTATGTRLVQQEANVQFKLKIQLFNKMVIEDIANFWKDLRVQFTTEDQVLRITESSEIKYLRDNTALSQTTQDGEESYPGDDRPRKLTIGNNGKFAFLRILPEDIQPYVVGDYDYIASTSSDQMTDMAAVTENFFTAVEKITNPNWVEGLKLQGKIPNYTELTEKLFEKLSVGIEGKDAIVDIQQEQPMQPQGMPQDMSQMMSQQPETMNQPMPQDTMQPEMMQEGMQSYE